MRWMLRVRRRSPYSKRRRRCWVTFGHAEFAGLMTIAAALAAMMSIKVARRVPRLCGSAYSSPVNHLRERESQRSTAGYGRKSGQSVNMTPPQITGQIPGFELVGKRGSLRRQRDHGFRDTGEPAG